MLIQTIIIITMIKIIFIPFYHSTDFEVHRNWLAITHNLSVDRWYYEATSEWTLDYPPLFAWMEYALSFVANLFDPKMLDLNNLNYKSDMTIMFQRLSVIALDFVYILGVTSCTNLVNNGRHLAVVLLLASPGLLMVDHIHFQYNGFLYGVQLFSISKMISGQYLQAAFWFAVLLNLKHIYLYVAPVYTIYLFRAYCCHNLPSQSHSTTGTRITISFTNFTKLALVVLTVFAVSFGPFVRHLPQVISRLFPFKRGLSHAYWAPNFWALYNFSDKVLQIVLPRLGVPVQSASASMTGGLVQQFEHSVLPSVSPGATFLLTTVSMLPALIKLWQLSADTSCRTLSFVRCLVVCATCSFMFGWHVHEKALLMALLPLSFLAVLGDVDGKLFLLLSTAGHYSLFPLLHPANLLPVKVLMLLTYTALAFQYVPTLYGASCQRPRRWRLPMLGPIESAYLCGLLVLSLYEHVLHPALGLHATLPFLPLMLTSVYCAVGVTYFWLSYYYYFLNFNTNRASAVPSHIKKTY